MEYSTENLTKNLKHNWVYLAWFSFYVILFWAITNQLALLLYSITVLLAFSPGSEELWRWVNGVRPLRLKSEKERLLPLFKEVYLGSAMIDPHLPRDIKLYIKEDMTINAFAFGKSTLILTRGSIMLLSDECLKGLMAHEFGHFSHKHTDVTLLMAIGNLPMMFVLRKVTDLKYSYDNSKNKPFIIVSALVNFIYYIFKGIAFIGDLILMKASRENEYVADQFAMKSGFGKDLADVLIEIYEVSANKPQSVKEQLKSTHPHITLRIESLEKAVY